MRDWPREGDITADEAASLRDRLGEALVRENNLRVALERSLLFASGIKLRNAGEKAARENLVNEIRAALNEQKS